MNAARAGSLLARLQQVPDPHGAQGRRHFFSAMQATIACADRADAAKLFSLWRNHWGSE